MITKALRDWLKTQATGYDHYYLGKTDPETPNSICVYSRPTSPMNTAVGGIERTTYQIRGISVLVQGTTSYTETETKAQEIYELLRGTRTSIDDKECFFIMKNDEAVSIGTNEYDIYEFVIDMDLVQERKV